MIAKPTTTARIAALESSLLALQGRVAVLEGRHEAKPTAAVDDVVRCDVCDHVIPAELLARDPSFFGIRVSTNAAGETVTHCSPTCAGASERTSR